MKKIIALLVAVVALVGIISGCVEEKATNKKPVADFTCVETGYVDETITFTDASTDEDGIITNYSWDLNDDDTVDSTNQNFSYQFIEPGTYSLVLTVTDDDGATSEEKSCEIVISYEPPTASFEYEPETNITVNVTSVNFTDTSTKGYANITSWSWDFDGDGEEDANTSTASYTFNTTGEITVSLTVTDEVGSTDTSEQMITVIEESTS